MSTSTAVRSLRLTIRQNAPVITTTLAIVSATATTVLAVNAGMSTRERLDAYKAEHEVEEIPTSDKIKQTWKIYIPTALMLASTVTSIVALHRVGLNREASALALYKVSEQAFSRYRNKVVEKLGEDSEKEVRESVAQDAINSNPPSGDVIVVQGSVLCFDTYSGRYFQSSMEDINRAVNDFNRKIIHENYASLTEFYELVGLEANGSSDDVGWMTDALLEVSYSSVLTPDGRPCLAVDFRNAPVVDYYRMA